MRAVSRSWTSSSSFWTWRRRVESDLYHFESRCWLLLRWWVRWRICARERSSFTVELARLGVEVAIHSLVYVGSMMYVYVYVYLWSTNVQFMLSY